MTSLLEEIDKATAERIKEMEMTFRRQLDTSKRSAIEVEDWDRWLTFVKKFKMEWCDDTLASLLAEFVTAIEVCHEAPVAKRSSSYTRELEKYLESYLDVIDEFHDVGHYRFCSFFAQRLTRKKFAAYTHCKRDILLPGDTFSLVVQHWIRQLSSRPPSDADFP